MLSVNLLKALFDDHCTTKRNVDVLSSETFFWWWCHFLVCFCIDFYGEVCVFLRGLPHKWCFHYSEEAVFPRREAALIFSPIVMRSLLIFSKRKTACLPFKKSGSGWIFVERGSVWAVGIGFGLIEMLSSKKDAIIWAFMIQFLLLCSLWCNVENII